MATDHQLLPMNADQSRDEPASPSSSIQHVSREKLEQREQALAALMRRREARTAAAAAKSSSGEMGDSSARLRETLRHEFQRSSDYAKKCHQLQEQVAAMQAQLEDANGREQVMLELCEELSRARSRGHELSAMLSEQTAEMLARVGPPQLEVDNASQSRALTNQAPSQTEGPNKNSSEEGLFKKFVGFFAYLAFGFAILVSVIALGFGTLALTFKVSSMAGSYRTYDPRRNVY